MVWITASWFQSRISAKVESLWNSYSQDNLCKERIKGDKNEKKFWKRPGIWSHYLDNASVFKVNGRLNIVKKLTKEELNIPKLDRRNKFVHINNVYSYKCWKTVLQ